MKRIPFGIAILTVAAALAGCGSHGHTHGRQAVPRGELASVKAESDSAVDRRIAQAQRWIEKAPKLSKGYAALGQALMQKGRETGELQNYNNALTAFEKAVEIEPDNSENLHNLAWCWTMFHNFPKAIELARMALKADPADPFAMGVLVDSYMELGRYEEAADMAQRMVDQRPNLASFSRVAQVQWAMGDVKNATLTMSKAVAGGGPYAENRAWCETQLGDMYWKTGAVKAAEQAYARVLERMPDFRHATFGMARVKAASGEWRAALDLYRKASADNPPIPYVVEYGEALESQGMASEAKAQFDRVEPMVETHLKHGIEGDELALAEFYMSRKSNLKKALALCQSEIEHHTAYQNFSALAWALHLNGKDAEALKMIEKAKSVGARDAKVLARHAAILESLGKFDLSRTEMAAARNLNPHFDLTAPFASTQRVARR